MRIRQASIIIAVFFSIGIFFLSNDVKAFTASPASGTFQPGSTQTIRLVASPPKTNLNVATLRISVTNMTITGYTPPSNVVGATSDCTGGARFTTSLICTSIGSTQAYNQGDDLGTITVEVGSSGTALITKDSGSSYSNISETLAESLGTMGTYSIATTPTTPTPVDNSGGNNNPSPTSNTNTPSVLPKTSSSGSNSLFILIGLTFLSLGALSFVSIDTLKRDKA